MTDLRTLADAFEELERRGDAAAARMPAGLPDRSPARRARLVPVAAAAVVVAGLAVSVALLAPGGEPAGNRAAEAPSSTELAPPSPAPAGGGEVPATPEELADRFRAILAGTATFEVTDTGSPARMTAPPAPDPNGAAPSVSDPNGAQPSASGGVRAPDPAGGQESAPPAADSTSTGAAIVGILTADGTSGGFDLQIYHGSADESAWCDGPENCTVTRLDDGSSLAVSTFDLEGPDGGVTHGVIVVRPDGVTTIMHVSNQRSPKGASEVLGDVPPLTAERMVEIVTSDLW